MKLRIKKLLRPRNIFYLIIGLLVFYVALSFIDPDFGWHLSAGNLILKSGFPKTDPFSYTMPSFSFIEHEWLADIIFAKLYPLVCTYGLSALSSILFLSAVYISVSKSRKLKAVFFIVGVSSLLPFFTNSPKVFSWLLFSLFTLAVFNGAFWKKYWLLTPLITILWVNLHGSFPEALVILLVILVCKSFREKRIWIKGLIVTFLSFLATLVNPYGTKLWWLIWLTVSDPLLKFRIAEWQPTYFNLFGFSFLAVFLFTISGVFISRYWRRFKTEEIVLNLIFFVQALFAVRNITYWVLVDLPMATMAINYFYNEVKNVEIVNRKIRKERFLVLSKVAFLFTCMVFVFQYLEIVYIHSNSYREDLFYPKGAVSYLGKNFPSGQVFSEYNWGGYLVWKLPEKRVFVYGMMPSWRWRENLPGQSNDAMGDYINITTGKIPYQTVFEKYNIDTVLLSAQREKVPFWGISVKADSKDVLYGELMKDNWKIVYQDSASVILERP